MLSRPSITTLEVRSPEPRRLMTVVPDMTRVIELTSGHICEVLQFLNERPVHTVVMTSFIRDNGIVSDLNRGTFYGYRNTDGTLSGVALIGHSTLVEARSDESLKAFAFTARNSKTPIHLIMSSGNAASKFWEHYSGGASSPRLVCTEELFEIGFPFAIRPNEWNLRNADMSHLLPVAEAQAEIAFLESGVDPMLIDREGFLRRVARRIEQNRVFVVFEDGKLIFKADIIAETDQTAYLEGIYVHPEFRGKGISPKCLSSLSRELLKRVENVCLLSSITFTNAHRSFQKAGFRNTDRCTTLFV